MPIKLIRKIAEGTNLRIKTVNDQLENRDKLETITKCNTIWLSKKYQQYKQTIN